MLTELHAGGKFQNDGEGNYKTSGGLHGVGASVVNALSKKLVASVKRDGSQYKMEFAQGRPTSKLLKAKLADGAVVRGTGTTITFTPDPQIFPRTEFHAETLRARLETVSFLHRGVEDRLHRRAGQAARGLPAGERHRRLPGHRCSRSGKARPIHDGAFRLEKDGDPRVEMTLQWTESTDEHLRSYVNGITTASGGSHENGFRAGLSKAVRNYLETHKLTPRGVKISHEDIREGLVGILSVFMGDPQFQGQTKDRLNNPEVQSAVDGALRPGARAVAQQQLVGGRADHRAHHHCQPGPRRQPRRVGVDLAQERDQPADAAGQALATAPAKNRAEQRAVHRRGRLRRRQRQAGSQTVPARRSCRCAARCSTPRASV